VLEGAYPGDRTPDCPPAWQRQAPSTVNLEQSVSKCTEMQSHMCQGPWVSFVTAHLRSHTVSPTTVMTAL
jgi:hypothetical protein